jgi:ArsR family transcriptional regulator
MELRCARCDKIIGPEDARVKDGNFVYCITCYGKTVMPQRYEDGVMKCSFCGKTLTRYDDQVTDGKKHYCKKCYESVKNRPTRDSIEVGKEFIPSHVTSMRDSDKLIECAHCGMVTILDQLSEGKDGKVRCHKCGKVLPIRFRGTWEAKNIPSLTTDDINAKKEDYSATAQLFKCLSDPCRVKIIELLSHRELCVFEFVDMTGSQYSAISYHLKLLKEMEMIKSYERGNFVVYSLTDKGETVHEFIEKSRDLK